MGITFLYPLYLLLIPMGVFLWWFFQVRRRSFYWVSHPAPQLLSRLESELKREAGRIRRSLRGRSVVFFALLAMIPAALVLAVPVEEKEEQKTVIFRREGCLILDVSGITLMPDKHKVTINQILMVA